jgi:FkbM family methyltransferase
VVNRVTTVLRSAAHYTLPWVAYRVTTVLRSTVHYTLPWVAYRLSHSRHRHDEIELELLPIFVDSAREAIDVGANTGRYTAPLAKIALHVHAFEPHPRLAHVPKSSSLRNVTVRQVAVSNVPGRVTLFVPVTNGRQDEGIAHIEENGDSPDCKTFPVEAITLDELASRNIGFVKIDVEGHEMSVLMGACKLISEQRPTMLVEAEDRHHVGALAEISSFFAKREYRGLFVHGAQLLPIEQFDTKMQDIELWKKLESGTPRKSIPYVNNFLFVPSERWADDLVEQAERQLETLSRQSKHETAGGHRA